MLGGDEEIQIAFYWGTLLSLTYLGVPGFGRFFFSGSTLPVEEVHLCKDS